MNESTSNETAIIVAEPLTADQTLRRRAEPFDTGLISAVSPVQDPIHFFSHWTDLTRDARDVRDVRIQTSIHFFLLLFLPLILMKSL